MLQTEQKYRELTALLKAFSPFVLAFSGGLDSRFLAHSALRAGLPFTAVHICGVHVPARETGAAIAWLCGRGIAHTTLEFNPLDLPDVAAGSKERCYSCKFEMFQRIQGRAGRKLVLDGSNASDLLKFRPGLRALQELGIISPLAMVGLHKAEIRSLAVSAGLDQAEQPSRPCLLTRLDYGVFPSEALLAGVEAAEEAVARLGFTDFRLRIFADKPPLLQIAWDEAQKLEALREKLDRALNLHGFEQVEMEAEIALSGYFDRGTGEKSHEELEIQGNFLRENQAIKL